MAVSLQKGQKVSITKDNPGLSNVVVGLGWDVNRFDTGGGFDLDTAAFMLGAQGIQIGTRFLVAEECTIHQAYKDRILKAKDIEKFLADLTPSQVVTYINNYLTIIYAIYFVVLSGLIFLRLKTIKH